MDSVEGNLHSAWSGDSNSHTGSFNSKQSLYTNHLLNHTPSGGSPQRRPREQPQNAHTHSQRRVLKCVLRTASERNSTGASTHNEKDAHTSEAYPIEEQATNCTPNGIKDKDRTDRTNWQKHNKRAKKTIDVATHSAEPKQVQGYVINDKDHASRCAEEMGKRQDNNKKKKRRRKSPPPASAVDAHRDKPAEGMHVSCPINRGGEQDDEDSEECDNTDAEGDNNEHGTRHLDHCPRPHQVHSSEESRRKLSIYKKKVNQVNKILYNLNFFNKFSSLEFRKGISQNKQQKETEIVEPTFTSVTPCSKCAHKESPTSLVTYTLHPKQRCLNNEENESRKDNRPSAMYQAVHISHKGTDTIALGRTRPTLHAAYHPYDEQSGQDSEYLNQVSINSNYDGSATPNEAHSRVHSQIATIKQKKLEQKMHLKLPILHDIKDFLKKKKKRKKKKKKKKKESGGSQVDSETANEGADGLQVNLSTSHRMQINQEEESQNNGSKYNTTLTNGGRMQSRSARHIEHLQQLLTPQSTFPEHVKKGSDYEMDTKTTPVPSGNGEAETATLLPLPSINTTSSNSKKCSHKNNPARKKEYVSVDSKDDISLFTPETSVISQTLGESHKTNKRKPEGEENHFHCNKCQEVGNIDHPSEPISTAFNRASQKKSNQNGTVFETTNDDSLDTAQLSTLAPSNIDVGMNEGMEGEQKNVNRRGNNEKSKKSKSSIPSNGKLNTTNEIVTKGEILSNVECNQTESSQLSRDEKKQSDSFANTGDDHTREPTSNAKDIPNDCSISPTWNINISEEIANIRMENGTENIIEKLSPLSCDDLLNIENITNASGTQHKKKKKRKKKKKKNYTEQVDTNEELKSTSQIVNSKEQKEIGQSAEEDTPYLRNKESSPMGRRLPQVEYHLGEKCNPTKGSTKGSQKSVMRKGSNGEEKGEMDSASTPEARTSNARVEKVDGCDVGSTPFGSSQLGINQAGSSRSRAPQLAPRKGTHKEKQRKKYHAQSHQIDVDDPCAMNPIIYTLISTYANRTMNPLPTNHGFCTPPNLSNVDHTKHYRYTSEDNFNLQNVLEQEDQSNVSEGNESFVNVPPTRDGYFEEREMPREGRDVHGRVDRIVNGGDNGSHQRDCIERSGSQQSGIPNRHNRDTHDEDYSVDLLSDNVSSFVSRDYANYVNYMNYMNYVNRMNPIRHANRLARIHRTLPQRTRRKGFPPKHLKLNYPTGATTFYMEDLWRSENERGPCSREPYFNHFKHGFANYMIGARDLGGMNRMRGINSVSGLSGAHNFGNPNRVGRMNNLINGQENFFPGRQNEARRNKARRLLQQPCGLPQQQYRPPIYGRQYRVKTFPNGGTDLNNYTEVGSSVMGVNNEDVASVEASLVAATDEVGGRYAPSVCENPRSITSSVSHRQDIDYNICTSVQTDHKPRNKIGPPHNKYHYVHTKGGQSEEAKGTHGPVKHDPFLCREVSYLGDCYNRGMNTPWDDVPYNHHLVVPVNKMGLPPIGTFDRGAQHSNNWSSNLNPGHVNVENNFPVGGNYPPGNRHVVLNAQETNPNPLHPDTTLFHQTVQRNREKMNYVPNHKWDMHNKLRIRKKKKKKYFNDEQYTQHSMYSADRSIFFSNDSNKFNAMCPLEYNNPLVNTFAGSYGKPSSGFYHLPYSGIIPPLGIPLRDLHSVTSSPHFPNLTNEGNFTNGDYFGENYGPTPNRTYQQGGNSLGSYSYKEILPLDQQHISHRDNPSQCPGETDKTNRMDKRKNNPPKERKKNLCSLPNGNRVEQDGIPERQCPSAEQMENETKRDAIYYTNDQLVDENEWKKFPTDDESRVLSTQQDLPNAYEGMDNGGPARIRLHKEKKKQKSASSNINQKNENKTNNYNRMVRKYNELKKCNHENVLVVGNDEEAYSVNTSTIGEPLCLFSNIKPRSVKQPAKGGEGTPMHGIENQEADPHECPNNYVEESYGYAPQNGQHLNDKRRKKKKKKKKKKKEEEKLGRAQKGRNRNQSCVTLSHYDKFIASSSHLPLQNGRRRSLSLNLEDKPRVHLLSFLHYAIQRCNVVKVGPPPTTLHRCDKGNNTTRNALQADISLLLRKTEELLIDLLKKVKPSKDIKRTKRKIFSLLSKLIKHLFTCDIKIYTVGSSAYGVDSKTSDLDIVIQANLYNPKYILRNIYNYIVQMKRKRKTEAEGKDNDAEWKDKYSTDSRSKVISDECHLSIHDKRNNRDATPLDPSECAFFDDVQLQLVDSARVPILTLRKNHIVCDVSVNTNNSLKHTEFFSSILKSFPNLKNVMRILKLVLKVRTLPSMKQGGLPTILWMMLSVCYCKLPMESSSFCESVEKYPFKKYDQGKGKEVGTSRGTSAVSTISTISDDAGAVLPCTAHLSRDRSKGRHTDQLKGRDPSHEPVCSFKEKKETLLNGGYYHEGKPNGMMENESIDRSPGRDKEDMNISPFKKRGNTGIRDVGTSPHGSPTIDGGAKTMGNSTFREELKKKGNQLGAPKKEDTKKTNTYISVEKKTAGGLPADVQVQKGLNDVTISPGWFSQTGETGGSSIRHTGEKYRKGENEPHSNNPNKSQDYNRSSSEGHLHKRGLSLHAIHNQPQGTIKDCDKEDAVLSGELKCKVEQMQITTSNSSPSLCNSVVNPCLSGMSPMPNGPMNSIPCDEPTEERDEKGEEKKTKKEAEEEDQTGQTCQTAGHFSSTSCHLVEKIFSQNEYEESSVNSCCHHYTKSCKQFWGSDDEEELEPVSTCSMHCWERLSHCGCPNCFDNSLTQSTRGKNPHTQQQKRKRNILKIMHRNGKILSQFEPPIGVAPTMEGTNEVSAMCLMNSQSGGRKDLEKETIGRRDQHMDSYDAVSESHLKALAPLFYSLMILFNELNSRKKLTKTINIIDEEKSHLKNADEINKRLLSSVCHGGVWDELLTLYDPIYSFNYERYISRANGKPKEKKQTSPPNSTTGSHMYRENFGTDPHTRNDITYSTWSKKKTKSLTPDECRKSGRSPAISLCSAREVQNIPWKDQGKEEINIKHHMEENNKIINESFFSRLGDVTLFHKMHVTKHSGKHKSVANGVVHSVSVDRVNCGSSSNPYLEEHPPSNKVKDPFVGDTVKTCGDTPPDKEIKIGQRITSGCSISTNSSSSGSGTDNAKDMHSSNFEKSHTRESDFLSSEKGILAADGRDKHGINTDLQNEVYLTEEDDKTNPFRPHNTPQLDPHCSIAGGVPPTKNSKGNVKHPSKLFSPHGICNTEMVKTVEGDICNGIKGPSQGTLRKVDRPSISENPPTRRREPYIYDEDVKTTTMNIIHPNAGRASHFSANSSNIAWGSFPHFGMRNPPVTTSGSYFNEILLTNSFSPCDMRLHGSIDRNFRIHDTALHMCSNEMNTYMTQNRGNTISHEQNRIRFQYNQYKYLTHKALVRKDKNNRAGNRVEEGRTTTRNVIQAKKNMQTFEKKYEQNIDLAGKVSSATWLIYLYELKRASFFINYYLHNLHLFICFKKHFNGGAEKKSNGPQAIPNEDSEGIHIIKPPCDSRTRITKNYEIFQKKQWLTVKINSRDQLTDVDKPILQKGKVLFPKATFPLFRQTEQPIVIHKVDQLYPFKRESPQGEKNFHSDEKMQTKENTTLSERVEKTNNLDPTRQLILKCILQNLKCCIHALFERTKGEIYVLPFHPQLGSSRVRRSSAEEIPSKGNHRNDAEREKPGGVFATPKGASTEDCCSINTLPTDGETHRRKSTNEKNKHLKEQSMEDPTDAENQFALVLIEGKLVFVKFVKICIDRNKFWDENFLCRRDIRTVMHVKAMDVLFISNKAIKMDKKKKKKNQDGTQVHPNSDTDTNGNLAKQIVTSSDTSDFDQVLLDDNSLDEDERLSKGYSMLSDFPDAASENVQKDAAAPGGSIKGEKPAANKTKQKANHVCDGKNHHFVDKSKRTTMKCWDYKKQIQKAKCSNFIYNSRNDYLGLLVEQNGGGRDQMIRVRTGQPGQTDEPSELPKQEEVLKRDDIFLINPCNFVTRVNVKTVYLPRRSLKDELTDTICERADLKESQMRKIFMLRKKGQPLSGSTVPCEGAQQRDYQTDGQKEKPAQDDDICCVRIIPRSEIMRYKELIRITRNSPFYYKKAKHISNNANPPLQQPVSVCNFCHTKGTFNVKTNHFTLSHMNTDVAESITKLLRQLIHGKCVSPQREK
ncbi:hypothetical protein AK88_05479 [Plasmodium fragile]|uniref:Poly(A) RNA polymerase mitochondrial-like central palm domain-containing protein n=1 Tax=Plasmodium fragile TaxID=5857 RepID=A0A0D9QGN5_PLAFR|nr:uncharacterized protein AK88_05479 [Plasmodium fragile]KJP84886.1 hypothetical protein AK88_05479 [Plasmodium fragile]